jgi:hypothetical protein
MGWGPHSQWWVEVVRSRGGTSRRGVADSLIRQIRRGREEDRIISKLSPLWIRGHSRRLLIKRLWWRSRASIRAWQNLIISHRWIGRSGMLTWNMWPLGIKCLIECRLQWTQWHSRINKSALYMILKMLGDLVRHLAGPQVINIHNILMGTILLWEHMVRVRPLASLFKGILNKTFSR